MVALKMAAPPFAQDGVPITMAEYLETSLADRPGSAAAHLPPSHARSIASKMRLHLTHPPSTFCADRRERRW